MFTPAPTTANSVSFDAIDAYVEEQMRHLHIPGVSLAIVEGDRLVHLHGFGKAQPGGRPPTPQTPFLIGSLTKSITALAVMQAVEAGKIELDAPVQRYLPWFRVMDPQASAQMTVRHLLVQTSGLPASAGESILAHIDNSPGAAERQARALSSLVPAHPVGDTFEYSNSNYQLLGLIIEAVTGKAYADYVQNSILTPLRMNHSHYPDPTGAKNGLAMGHQYWFGRPVEAPDIPLPYGAMAAGLLISTAEDLAHYLIAHLNGGCYHDAQLLSPAGIAELHRGAAEFGVAGLGPIVGLLTKNMEMGQYGMGWNVNKIGQDELIWHGGTMPNFGGFMALLPEQKKGLVLLFQYLPSLAEPRAGRSRDGSGRASGRGKSQATVYQHHPLDIARPTAHPHLSDRGRRGHAAPGQTLGHRLPTPPASCSGGVASRRVPACLQCVGCSAGPETLAKPPTWLSEALHARFLFDCCHLWRPRATDELSARRTAHQGVAKTCDSNDRLITKGVRYERQTRPSSRGRSCARAAGLAEHARYILAGP